MSKLAQAALAFVLLALAFFAGWHSHAWYAGTTVTTADSATQAQDFVTAAAQATTRIDAAEGNAEQARERTRERIKYVEVDKGCPPGRGAVSDDMRERLRVAFEQEGGKP